MSSKLSQAGLPSSFDPFKTHPFTNISRAPQPMPAPNPYPRPVPTYQAHGESGRAAPPPPPSALYAPSSLPTAQTPVHSPQPQRASPRATTMTATTRTHVFEPFKLERASPELQDVLAKKLPGGTSSPGRRFSGSGNRDDAKQKIQGAK